MTQFDEVLDAKNTAKECLSDTRCDEQRSDAAIPHFSRFQHILLIDLSNSNTKFALATDASLLEKRSAPTAALSEQVLEETIAGWAPEAVLMASVVPKTTSIILSFFEKKKIPVLLVNAQMDLGIEMSYPRSTPIGADCLANIVAAKKFYPTPSIVIDLGTAITFDVIDASGLYLGIVIAPGLMTSAKALHEHTALLPQLTPVTLESAAKELLPASVTAVEGMLTRTVLGKNTIDAMLSGLIVGTQGLIRDVIKRLSEENFPSQKPTIIATGGDAALIGEGSALFDIIDPHLTLEGLREIACRVLPPLPSS